MRRFVRFAAAFIFFVSGFVLVMIDAGPAGAATTQGSCYVNVTVLPAGAAGSHTPSAYTVTCTGVNTHISYLQGAFVASGKLFGYGITNVGGSGGLPTDSGVSDSYDSTTASSTDAGCANGIGSVALSTNAQTNLSGWELCGLTYVQTGTTGAACSTYSAGFGGWGVSPCPSITYSGVVTSAAQGCQLTNGSGQTGQTMDGTHTYSYTVAWSGEATVIVANDDADTTHSVTINSHTFTGMLGSAIAPLQSPENIGGVGVSGHTFNPHLWCYDPSTGWVDWGLANAINVIGPPAPPPVVPGQSGDGGQFSFSQCFSTSGLGWDPASWVPALANILVCGVKWLFVPTSNTVQSFEKTFGITSNAPTGTVPAAEWLGAMAKGAISFPATEANAIGTVVSSGSCTGSAPFNPTVSLPGAGHTLTMCQILTAPASNATVSSSGTLTFVKSLLTAIVYLFAAFLLFHMFKRVIGGS